MLRRDRVACAGGRRRSSGFTLLEVIVALAILGTAVTSLVAVGAQSVHAVAVARAHEAELRAASRFLESVALWPRADLDRRLGWRQQGQWRLYIERVSPTLYVVILTDERAGRELLRTMLHRRDVREVGTASGGDHG